MAVYKEQNFKTNVFVVKFHFSGVVLCLSPFFFCKDPLFFTVNRMGCG